MMSTLKSHSALSTIASLLCVLSVSASFGQSNYSTPRFLSPQLSNPNKPISIVEKANTIWGSTFDNPADWVFDHDTAMCDLDWQVGIGLSCQGSFAIDQLPNSPFSSTTVADGFAMIDSDFYGETTGGSGVEDSWLTTSAPIDLNGFPDVVLEFETYYRRYNSERPYLVIGVGDGSGPSSVVWPDLDPSTDISAMNNVFDVFPNWPDATSTDNPQVVQINISQALAGLSATELADIYIRFNWTGTWGYAWFVDDLNVFEQPADDIQMKTAWIVGTSNEGIEYGRTPSDQVDSAYIVGAEVFNFGINDQDNLVMDADFTSFTSQATQVLLEADTSAYMESTETPSLPVGLYSGTYTVVSDAETGGANFADNTYERNFEITNNVYSVDGIGNHPVGYEKLASIGTDSFSGGEDGLVCATMYHIKNTEDVGALRVMLADSTEVGATVYGSIKDTATFFAGNMASLYSTDPVTVTAGNIAEGYITLEFPGGAVLDTGAYFASIEMYSNDSLNHIRILDDKTVAQPWYASMIYIPNDQSYAIGEAFAIRMLVNTVGIDETSLEGIKVYPNPSQGIVNISNDNNLDNTITVHDLAGRIVLATSASSNTTIDLSGNGTGVYLVTVANKSGKVVERVVIN